MTKLLEWLEANLVPQESEAHDGQLAHGGGRIRTGVSTRACMATGPVPARR